MKSTAELVRVKEVCAWADGAGHIQIKAITPAGAPVELSSAEAKTLAERLLKLAQTVESLQAQESE